MKRKMKRIIRLWAVAAVMTAMLAMSASASWAQEPLPPESCTGIVTAQQNAQTHPGLDKPPPGVPFSTIVKCDV
jgi:hypothetical protein